MSSNLTIDFNLENGILHGICNKSAGMEISFGEVGMRWRVEVETSDSTISLTSANSRMVSCENSKVMFLHELTGVEVLLSLITLDNDLMGLKLSATVADESFILRKLIIENVEPVQITSVKGADTLVYPCTGGMKIKDPANEFFVPEEYRQADWKDRKLTVYKKGFFMGEDGIAERSTRGSMQWMDYYSEKGGLYLGMHDENFEHWELAARAHKGKPGLAFRLTKIFNRRLDEVSCVFAIGLHSGDWHRGADIYREFFDKSKSVIRKVPDVFTKEPGIVVHWDFKWQNGDIAHYFRDLPLLAKEAQAAGFNLLHIAGWNKGGFDNNYPDFTPDPDLGTEEELQKAIKDVHNMGAKVFFYVNAYSFDEECEDYEVSGQKWAVRQKNNKVLRTNWGGQTVLVGMCNSAQGWRRRVKDNIKYVIETLGADGVDLDQLGVMPKVCYSTQHEHKNGWIRNNVSLIQEVVDELGKECRDRIFLFGEFVTDISHTQLDAQRILTCWPNRIDYGFPEMYRYTFPEALCLDHVFQKPWGGIPYDVEEEFISQIIRRYFINGIWFWTYDHALCNPRVGDFLRQTVALKKSVSNVFQHGTFQDEKGIEDCSVGIHAKTYSLSNGRAIAIWNTTGKKGMITISKEFEGTLKLYRLNGDETSESFCGYKLAVPEDELCMIVLESDND